ncbi:Hypothetical Protein FCC1311_090422 [Hondaea fermentalgiana]|uniref:Uncharacterized protein n=1 Tax=Hondaea fermentalgiana TaxID=2315210 RepID=A0A2R5GPM3_9STRA|nr:Hypothetical Protein FCC1311_090422 [Hondaea fermentalgiana]|eukprot:GBG32817.1 Hypothetical Protein FCC1311_090422 [Hondaea fermentalgiana]
MADPEAELSAAMAELTAQLDASWEGGVNADDNEMLSAARQDPEEARDMAFGRNAWQNVPAIVRDKMLVLSQTVATQATEIADLRSIVTALQESSRDAASQTWVETNVKKLSSTQDARIEGLARRVDHMRQTVDLKADAAYLTSCLLTKANKSEVNSMQAKVDRAAERVETNLRQQHDDRWERLQRASEAYREGVAMQLQEALRSMSTQRAKIDERIARVQASMRDRLDRPETTESGGSSSGSDNFGYDEPRSAHAANGELIRGKSRRRTHGPVHGGKTGSNADPTASREFNSLVRQVETLAAVQSKMQQVMQELESRVDLSASKTDLQSIAAEKANKLSVANAIHRKANKDDLENTIAALTARLQAVEDGLSGGSARPSTGKMGRLRTDLDRALKALENVPSLEQVGTALDKLAEELKPQIDNALLGVDQLRRNAGKNHAGTGVNEGASGIANLSAIEGRVRAAHERCASLQSDLEERFGDVTARLRSVEDQIVAQDLVAKRMELSGVTHHDDNIDDEIEDVALEIVFSDSDEDNKEFRII